MSTCSSNHIFIWQCLKRNWHSWSFLFFPQSYELFSEIVSIWIFISIENDHLYSFLLWTFFLYCHDCVCRSWNPIKNQISLIWKAVKIEKSTSDWCESKHFEKRKEKNGLLRPQKSNCFFEWIARTIRAWIVSTSNQSTAHSQFLWTCVRPLVLTHWRE